MMGTGKALGLCVLSGLLAAAAFPKLNLGFLAWVALVPMFVAVRGCGPGGALLRGWVAGVTFYFATLSWIAPTIDNFTRLPPPAAFALGLLLAAVCAYNFAGAAVLTERLAAGGVTRLLAAPLAWVALEWSRTFVLGGFPWASLGYSQHGALHLIQIADLGGVYTVSALLVFVNLGFVEIIADRRRVRRVLPWLVALPVLAMGYGAFRLAAVDRTAVEGTLDVAYVQGNVAQADKWNPDLQNEILIRHLELSAEAAAAGAELVVWPEASIPFDLAADRRAENLADFAQEHEIFILAGAPGVEADADGQELTYNRAWLLTPGRLVLGPYDKMQLVPFGEYVPLGGLFGLVDIVVHSAGALGRGDTPLVFAGPQLQELAADESGDPESGDRAGGDQPKEVRAARFGTLICYEGIFPALARRFAVDGADFLVNISNDAWYGDTAAPYQHLSMTVFRAIENRMPVVRATNTGVSAFIDARGAEGVRSSLFEPDIGLQRILVRSIGSPYRKVGDVFVYLCLLATLALLVRARIVGGPFRKGADRGDALGE